MEERLQKYMAECGIASRRKSEELISEGKVKVNGVIITEIGSKIDPSTDSVEFENRKIIPPQKRTYIILNKPTGYVSTCKDERGRKTVIDLIAVSKRIFSIGRLDYDTSGLLLFTDDGEIYNKVIHPRQSVDKEYIAEIYGIPSSEDMKKFCSGIDIGGYITAPAEFKIIKSDENISKVLIKIHEGKNRQIRRMCKAIDHPVIKLKRIAVGNIMLGNLKEGKWRYLSEEEVNYLKNL